MKRSLLLGAVSAIAMIASAHAADLGGGMKETAAPPLWNWAGWYAGVNGGYIWDQGGVSALDQEWFQTCSDSCGSVYSFADRHQTQLDGGFGGGQIGFNWQRDRLVYGIETDIQGSSLSASRNAFPNDGGNPSFSDGHAEANLDWFGSFRGRLGLVPWQNVLLYITGGVAYGGFEEKLRHDVGWGQSSFSGDHSDVFAGYDLGAGVEYGWSPAWSVKFEYQFMDLGSVHLRDFQSGSFSCGSCTVYYATNADSEVKLSFNTVRVGINYHFIPEYVPLK